MAKASTILKELSAAAKDLLFPSETDAPLEAFAWPGGSDAPDEAAVRTNAAVPEDTHVEEITLAALKRTIPSESRADFQPLFATLAKYLSDVTVFKVGEVSIDVYIVGRTADGQYAGLKTEVVET